MEKHEFNLFPKPQGKDYERLYNDLKENGYDKRKPIYKFEGKILDGWTRYEICKELNIKPKYKEFKGSKSDALDFVMRTNKRRNLNSSQWATIAVEAEELREELGKQAKERQKAKLKQGNKTPVSQEIDEREKGRVDKKLAKTFNTNRQYIQDAINIKDENPEDFEQIRNGKKTITKYNKDKAKEEREQTIKDEIAQSPTPPTIELSDYADWLQTQDKCDLLITDPPYMTDLDDVSKFAEQWLPLALNKVKDTGRAYVFIGAYPKELESYLSLDCIDHLTLEQILVWTYENTLGPSPNKNYKLNWQAILYFRGIEANNLNCPKMTEQFTVQKINAPDARQDIRYHKWEKPLDLAERLIRHSTSKDDLIIDPFAGTGTFLLAASKLGRKGIGCDSSKTMLDIAEQRGCKIANHSS